MLLNVVMVIPMALSMMTMASTVAVLFSSLGLDLVLLQDFLVSFSLLSRLLIHDQLILLIRS